MSGLSKPSAFLDAMIAAAPEESDDYVVEHQGRVIGKAGCWRLPEVGYILHPDYWGQGLAREALAAVIYRRRPTSGAEVQLPSGSGQPMKGLGARLLYWMVDISGRASVSKLDG